MKTSTIVRSALFTAICLLASKLPSSAQSSILVPGGTFTTAGPSESLYGFIGGVYTGGNNPYYANQNPAGANPYPDAELYSGWVSDAGNYQSYRTSVVGAPGLAPGITTAIQVNGSYGTTNVSLNPVVASIAGGSIYTFTLSLAQYGNTGTNVTLALVSTTSAADPTNYQTANNYTYSTSLLGTQSPYNPTPLITSTVLESFVIPAATINAQGSGVFQDYSVSLDTYKYGADAGDVGSNLSLLVYEQGYGGSVLFTDARLTQEVPEPSTWALMLAGLAGLFIVGRRKLVS